MKMGIEINVYIKEGIEDVPIKKRKGTKFLSIKKIMGLKKITTKNTNIIIKKCSVEEISFLYCKLCSVIVSDIIPDIIIVNETISKVEVLSLQRIFDITGQMQKPLCRCNLGNHILKEIKKDFKNVVH